MMGSNDKEDRIVELLDKLKEALLATLEYEAEGPQGNGHNAFPEAPFACSMMVGCEPETKADCHTKEQRKELSEWGGKLARVGLTMNAAEARSLRNAIDLQLKQGEETIQVCVSGDLSRLRPSSEEL
jgi:hypothetical protein